MKAFNLDTELIWAYAALDSKKEVLVSAQHFGNAAVCRDYVTRIKKYLTNDRPAYPEWYWATEPACMIWLIYQPNVSKSTH